MSLCATCMNTSRKGNHVKNVAGAKWGKRNCLLYHYEFPCERERLSWFHILCLGAVDQDRAEPVSPSMGTSAHGSAVHALPLLLTPLRNTTNGILLFLTTLRLAKPICEATNRGFHPQLPCLAKCFCSKSSVFVGSSQVKKSHAGLPDLAVFCT